MFTVPLMSLLTYSFTQDSSNPWLEQVFTAIGLPPDVPSPKSMIVASRDEIKGKKSIKIKKNVVGTSHNSIKADQVDNFVDSRIVPIVVDSEVTSLRGNASNISATVHKGGDINDVPFDGIIFLGDFNYRVNLPRFEIESYKYQLEKLLKRSNVSFSIPVTQRINNLNYDNFYSILRHDQLLKEMHRGNAFVGFNEAKITFLPTFKYDKGYNSFDTSKKSRNPAWTDRILFAQSITNSSNSSVPFIEQTLYTSIDNRHSDHRPVFAQYKIYY